MSQHIKDAISRKITSLIDCDDRLGEMLSYSVGRLILESESGSVKKIRKHLAAVDFFSITQWLKFSIRNNSPWLNQVDNQGRPEKLMAFANMAEVDTEIQSDMVVATQEDSVITSSNGDTLNVHHLPENLIMTGGLYLKHTNITSLPEGLTVGGNLILLDTNITSLPKGLTVGGDLILLDTKITSLPEGLTVDGNLDLSGTNIRSLPEGLTVSGSLDIRRTNITSLPEVLTVGCLDIGGTKVSSLPLDIFIGESVNISDTSITSLPTSCHDELEIITDFGTFSAEEFRQQDSYNYIFRELGASSW